VRGDAQDTHSPGQDLYHEQHIHALEEHGIDMQEIARQDGGCLAGQELSPGRRRPPRRGIQSGGGQDPADRPLTYPVPQTEQLTLDAPAPVGLEYTNAAVTCYFSRVAHGGQAAI
jgi:hypothetical protein